MSVSGDSLMTIEVLIKCETDRAVLIDFEDEDIWLPLSQIEIEADVDGEVRQIEMPTWLAREKQII